MKRMIVTLLIIGLTIVIHTQDKSKFDVEVGKLYKLQSSALASNSRLLEVKNGFVHLTLLSGGYFTLGTTSGISSSTLDDNCQLTYGHPYAMTSYPLFSVDGSWYKVDEYFSDSEINISSVADTLTLTATRLGTIELIFSMYYDKTEQKVKYVERIINLDTRNHSYGAGLVYDPAIGKNGDGSLEITSGFLNSNKIWTSVDVPDEYVLWEKYTGSKGIGIGISFTEKPTKVVAGNWNDLYNNQSPDVTPNTSQYLFDLLLKFYWTENSVPSGAEKKVTTSISLKQPDFSGAVFLRWDMPLSLAMDNNILFPQSFDTYVQMLKSSSTGTGNYSLNLEMPGTISASTTLFSYGSSVPDFQKIQTNAQIVYETKVEENIVKIMNGSQVVDELHRYVFIPATPVSDSGLTVAIDSIIRTTQPKISFLFDATQNTKGTKITNLSSANIFLYENSQRILDYILTKDTTGGANAADIIFALDVTGSMTGMIDAVKKNIIEFGDSLSKSGIDYQLGLVTFLDIIENVYPFTKDITTFKNNISAQYAHGGDDYPENSLQALLTSSQYKFRDNSKRVIIWITDASYHESDGFTSLTKKIVLDSLLAKGITVNAIGPTENKSSWYDPIVIPTNGSFYDYAGNFRDILVSIARMKYAYKYIVSYNSPTADIDHNIKLQIRYAGLGGETSFTVPSMGAKIVTRFSCYPNPFNPDITFRVTKGEFKSGKITIYNILGHRIKEFNLSDNNSGNIRWNARNERGDLVGTGFYFAQLTLFDMQNKKYVETAKILYLK